MGAAGSSFLRHTSNRPACRWLIQAAEWAEHGLPEDLEVPEIHGHEDVQVFMQAVPHASCTCALAAS